MNTQICQQNNKENKSKLLNRKKSTGFSLIEVLVAVVVISFGLLSIGMLQIKSLQYTQNSYNRAIVTIQANDLKERLWSDACNLNTNRNAIRNAWIADNANSMNAWSGAVTYPTTANPFYVVTISWSHGQLNEQESFSYAFAVPNMECE